MKVLLDPVHTQDPDKCAGNFKMQLIARHLVETLPDAYITYFLPKSAPDDTTCYWTVDESKMFQHPRVKYEYLTASKDRIRDMLYPPQDWAGAMMFNGTHWDADLIVTGRMLQGPTIQVLKGSTKTGVDSFKRYRVLGNENFPMIPNKGAVPYYEQICDNLVYGHLGFDTTYVHIEYFRDIILQRGRDMLSPAKQRKLANTVQCVQPLQITDTHVKTAKELRALTKGDLPFTVAYTQRFDVVRRRTDDVFESMKKHWIMHAKEGSPVRCIVSSVSKSKGRAKMKYTADGFEQVTKGRDEYLQMLKDEVHAVVVLSREEGHSFTTIEPILMGVPVVLGRRPWSEALVGKDYPFFVKSVQEAYTLLRAMSTDYVGQYRVFHDWLVGTYWPLLQQRNEGWLGVAVERELVSLTNTLREAYEAKTLNPSAMTQALLPVIKARGSEPFSLADILAEAFKQKLIDYDHAPRVTDPAMGWRNSRTGSFSQGLYLNKIRHDLMFAYGYEDAAPDQGVMQCAAP